MSLRKKIIVGCSIALAVIIAVVAVVLFAPLPMNVDWDAIYDLESNVTLLEANAEGNPTDAPALIKLNSDGTVDTTDWKVLQFTDLHFSEKNKGDFGNDRTIEKMMKAIESDRPDFVVFTGDIITSFRGRARAVQLCEIMEKYGIYWAYNLGNHEGDAWYKLPRKDLMEIIEKYPHCLSDASIKKTVSTKEEVWGIGNFVVNLLGEDHKVVQSMIFMDSGDEITNDDAKKFNVKKGTYDYLKPSQLVWYEEQVRKVTDNLTNGVKTMLFIHIPLVQQRNMRFINPEGADEQKEGWTMETPIEGWTYLTDIVAKNHDGEVVGRIAVKDGWNAVKGTANFENVSCSQVENGMYDLMKSLRVGVNALFCGHDHINNSVIYETTEEGESPIYLCYGITGGYTAYNLYKKNLTEDPDNLMRGYSVITIHQNGTFDYAGVSYDYDYSVSEYIQNSLPKA